MNVTLVPSSTVFNQALAAARAAAPMPAVKLAGGAQPSILDGALLGRLEEAWETIERGLAQAYAMGRDVAQEWIDKANAQIGEIMQSAGVRFRQAQAWLQEKLHSFVRAFIAGSVAALAAQHTVGGAEFRLSTLTSSQKLKLAGNLKASIEEVFALVCEGELVVEAVYTRA